ncbi:MAG: hypothetical protein ACI8ZW_001156 [Yoonia sp.]|jgi:hypothetical protein
MHHFSTKLQVEDLSSQRFIFDEPQLLIGFVLSGWAKISVPDHGVEKLEPGYYFIYESDQLCIDRTCSESAHLNLFTCSQAFAQSLLELELVKENHALEQFVHGKQQSQSKFQCHPMTSVAFELGQKLTYSELKHRLTLEANALLWVAEVLKDGNSQSAKNTTLNADDRDAIETITEHMKGTPGYEYSLAAKSPWRVAHNPAITQMILSL